MSPVAVAPVKPEKLPRQTLTVLDISRKRRSGSCESSPTGRPFINPIDRMMRSKPRRSFFRDVKEADTKPSLSSLLAIVHGLTQAQAFKVALAFRLSPPNSEKLHEFVANIAAQDERMINAVMSVTSNVVKVRSEGGAVNTGFEFFDCRYGHLGTQDECFKIGNAPLDFHFPIPSAGVHRIVLQCFLADVNPPVLRWPLSLRIFINDKQIKPPGVFRFPLIDLTGFGTGSDVRVVYDMDGGNYVLMLRQAEFHPFRDLVLKIESERTVNDVFNELETSVFSPISGEIMKHPGRGKYCRHSQCFDLKEFLRTATATQSWVCPICRNPTFLEDLISSGPMRRILYELKPKERKAAEPPAATEEPTVSVIDDRSGTELSMPLFDCKDDEWLLTL